MHSTHSLSMTHRLKIVDIKSSKKEKEGPVLKEFKARTVNQKLVAVYTTVYILQRFLSDPWHIKHSYDLCLRVLNSIIF